MATIIVIPNLEQKSYKAFVESDPENFGEGSTVYEAVGAFVRCNTETLELSDSDLQVQFGVPWEDMTNVELGCLVVRDRNVGITIDVRGRLHKE